MDRSNRIILDLCGGTGSWSYPYKEAGYDVRNITLPDYDVREYQPPEDVYGILAAPPCPMFSLARTNAKTLRDFRGGMELVIACLNIVWECQYRPFNNRSKFTRLKFWAIENPAGMLKFFLGRPIFEFNPYDFGDNYKKHTCLWGWFNLPKKTPVACFQPKFDQLLTREIHPEWYGKLTRQERRAITPEGFARAFFEANQ